MKVVHQNSKQFWARRSDIQEVDLRTAIAIEGLKRCGNCHAYAKSSTYTKFSVDMSTGAGLPWNWVRAWTVSLVRF